MRRLGRMILWGVLTGCIGILAMTPAGIRKFEEDLDLAVLFKLRGPRPAPADVVLVNIDPASARQFKLDPDPSQWPRELHARLIDRLAEQGARTITFDVVFRRPRSTQGDDALAHAMRKAGNVVLCGYLQEEIHPARAAQGRRDSQIYVERLIPPIPALARTAAGVAPFPLPKHPVRLNQFWAFKTSAAGMPTLPAVTFQVYSARAHGHLMRLLNLVAPEPSGKQPPEMETVAAPTRTTDIMDATRQKFLEQPDLAATLRKALKEDAELREDPGTRGLVSALINLYAGADSRFINYYGPAETITTMPYAQALGAATSSKLLPEIDFKNKAVFVGLSERIRNDQADGFYTIFSQSSGLDISGVEIAASVFANIRDDTLVQPLAPQDQAGLLGVWGLLCGALCLLSPLYAALALIGAGVLYLVGGLHLFSHNSTWLPLAIPLLIQTPFAFLGSQFQRHYLTARERRNIRRAFGYHLPATVVDRLAQNFNHIREDSQIVYGICLFTDAQHYTTLSETMPPEDLSRFLNQYYQLIFQPVQDHGGIVSDLKGDSMLAIWNASQPSPRLSIQACRAALEISRAVNQPGRSAPEPVLPTRVGIHAGDIHLGHIGAGKHYEYRPVGDIVNTASRIEGLNKFLGTRVLVSEEIAMTVEGFFTRLMGAFLVAGKTRPVTIYELVGEESTVPAQVRELAQAFTAGLALFRQRRWSQAIREFEKARSINPDDGTTRLYLKLCRQYQVLPPDDTFAGVVVTGSK